MSNVCIACIPEYRRARIVNMIGVCLDTTITTSHCDRYTFRPFDFAPAQAVAFSPYLVNSIGKKWHILFADYAWGPIHPRRLPGRHRKPGRRSGRHHRHSARHRRHGALPQQDPGRFRRPVHDLFRQGRRQRCYPGVQPRSAQQVPFCRRRRRGGGGHQSPRHRGRRRWASSVSTATCRSSRDRSTPTTTGSFSDAVFEQSKQYDPNGILPDRYSQSNFEALNVLKVGMEACDFRGRRGHRQAHRGAGGSASVCR